MNVGGLIGNLSNSGTTAVTSASSSGNVTIAYTSGYETSCGGGGCSVAGNFGGLIGIISGGVTGSSETGSVNSTVNGTLNVGGFGGTQSRLDHVIQ